MNLKSLQLTNFRNHKNLKLDFKDINIIYGPNASGKTGILEAIYMLSGNNSFRLGKKDQAINWDSNYLKITGVLANQTPLSLLIKEGGRPTYQINHAKKARKVFSIQFKAVLFCHNDLDILESSPSKRRQFLDNSLLFDQQYKLIINQYSKLIRNRNKLLERIREGQEGETSLAYWDSKLLKLADYIEKERNNYFDFLSNFLPRIITHFDKLFVGGNIAAVYHQKEVSAETLRASRQKEIAAAQTLKGPHRADFSILRGERDQGVYGSRGQQKSLIIALKKAEGEYIYKRSGIRPVILLDDVFSELDRNSIAAVQKLLNNSQAFITTTKRLTSAGIWGKSKFPGRQVLFFELFRHSG